MLRGDRKRKQVKEASPAGAQGNRVRCRETEKRHQKRRLHRINVKGFERAHTNSTTGGPEYSPTIKTVQPGKNTFLATKNEPIQSLWGNRRRALIDMPPSAKVRSKNVQKRQRDDGQGAGTREKEKSHIRIASVEGQGPRCRKV